MNVGDDSDLYVHIELDPKPNHRPKSNEFAINNVNNPEFDRLDRPITPCRFVVFDDWIAYRLRAFSEATEAMVMQSRSRVADR